MFFKPDPKKAIQKQKEEIVMDLPGFINQLLLLMDSGLILRDAFKKIAYEYAMLPEKDRDHFTEKVAGIAEDSEKSGMDVISGFYYYACGSNVKELTKTANFLYENKSRGTELW